MNTSGIKHTCRFVAQFLSRPAMTGAVMPSSTALARTIVEGLELERARAVLEYGPGTGAFTERILEKLPRESKFLAIEANPRLAAIFKSRQPQVPLVQDSVANVRTICDYAGIDRVDCIVSGLPWAAFPAAMQVKFLDEMMRVLARNGRFATFAYLHGLLLPPGKRFARLLPKYFGSVSKSRVVWRNLPPALVYRCRR